MSADDNGTPADPPEINSDGLEFGEDAPPPITLDRYLSRRRPPVRMGWAQALSMLAMLAGLILILVYKDGCGARVSGLMHTVAPGAPEDRPAAAVRYQLPPDELPPDGERAAEDSSASAPKQPAATQPSDRPR